ncbi:MAG TPA: hypothetical protein VNT22_01860, partial [Baekduia sp.]|nr:hypothetical protein [Baekduia sp.]
MKVLFLARAGNESPWLEDFRASLGDAYDVVLWSAQRPFAEQVEGAVAIADLGAPLNQEMFAAARAAGISLWQIIGAGSDHIDRAWVTPEGFPIANIPGPQSARALAEHALMLMLTIARRFRLTQE